jgi:hypothetical protein
MRSVTFQVVAVEQLDGVLLRDGQQLGLVDGASRAPETARGPTPEQTRIFRDRCYDFLNILAEKFGEKIGVFDSKQS